MMTADQDTVDAVANALDENFGGVIERDADRIARFIVEHRDLEDSSLAGELGVKFGGAVRRDARKAVRIARTALS